MIKAKMLIVTVVMTTAILDSGATKAAIDPNNLYDIDTIHSLYIVMAPSDYEAMRFSADTAMGKVYPEEIEPGVWEHTYWQGYLSDKPAGPFINVAVRRKSDPAHPSEADPQKFSLKIDISRPKSGFTPENQRFGGKKKLSLECGSDSSIVSEGLAWNIYNAAGVIASRSAWIKVYMSTDFGASFRYMGLYNNVEQVDEEFLEDHMPDRHDYGFLYKIADYNGEIKKTREDETNPFEFCWYPFDHPSYITEIVPPPADWLTQTSERVDMDQLIKFAAVENFVANEDGTINKGNNYWYYDWATHPIDPNLMDPAYKQPRMYFPWDLDTTMKSSAAEMSIMHAQNGHFVEGLILEQDESGMPFGYDTYQAVYFDTYRDLLDGPLAKTKLLALITTIETAITTELDADPYVETTSTKKFNRLRSFVQDRWDSVEEQLNYHAPLPGIVLLDDGFENATWDTHWNDSAHNWLEDSDPVHNGSASAWAKQGYAGNFTLDSLDAGDAEAIHVRFWIQKDDIESGEFELYYYNGTSYNLIADLDTLGSDDTWLAYSDTITDSQYFVSDFRIRFVASPSDNKENVWIDDVSISKQTDLLTISGYVEEADHTPIAAVSVTADNGGGSGSTNEDGYYELSVDYDWSGTVTPQLVGYTFDPTDRSFSNVTADQSNQDYSGTLLTYVISGYILESDATPVVDVLVTADNDGGSNTTDINGYYELVVDHSWSGTTTPTKEGYSFNPATINYTNVITDLPNQNYTGVLILLTISGHILSPSGTGVEYVEVVASNSGGSDATDPNGYYELHVQYNWSGSVTPARENYACNPITIPCTQVTSNQEDQDYLITLKADLQPDGIINLLDLLVLKQYWLHTGPSVADLSQNDFVNLADVAILTRFWHLAY